MQRRGSKLFVWMHVLTTPIYIALPVPLRPLSTQSLLDRCPRIYSTLTTNLHRNSRWASQLRKCCSNPRQRISCPVRRPIHWTTWCPYLETRPCHPLLQSHRQGMPSNRQARRWISSEGQMAYLRQRYCRLCRANKRISLGYSKQMEVARQNRILTASVLGALQTIVTYKIKTVFADSKYHL
jgi:hypothetical protein